MGSTDRAARMGRRLEGTALSLGVDPSGLRLVGRAYALAMEPRREALEDDHDPDYLHPGRCAVILMDDLDQTDSKVIAAGSLVETERPELAVDPTRIASDLAVDVADLVSRTPRPGSADLAEALVVEDLSVRLIALVERLDQLRHAHLWADMERKGRAHREAEGVYLPVARRTHPTLARRYAWWCSMFRRRYLS